MFKQINYKVVEMTPAVRISEVMKLYLTDAGATEAVTKPAKPTDQGRVIQIDWQNTFLVEFTGKFSKEGKKIWSGDVLELSEAHQSAPAGLYIVSWTPGSFMAFHTHDSVSVPLFDESCIGKMEHRGNQWENVDLLQKYLDQFKGDVELKVAELPQ